MNENTLTRTMAAQIGRMNVLAISGGRIRIINDTTIDLPVRQGYSVEVEYIRGADLYTVRRILTRRRKGADTPTRTVKGELEGVYCDQLGDIAFSASCYGEPFGD